MKLKYMIPYGSFNIYVNLSNSSINQLTYCKPVWIIEQTQAFFHSFLLLSPVRFFVHGSSTLRDITPSRALLATSFQSGFMLCLFFDPEDGGDIFLRNVC
jgi:hypothetical protein